MNDIPKVGDRIKFRTGESDFEIDLTIDELEARGDAILIKRATIHSANLKLNKIPEGWTYNQESGEK